jgi:hypothetical protein
MNYSFGKNICAELVNTGGAAAKWLITDEFSTDLDEMGIFVLSKDQTFKICATFLDPAKFCILVIHLLIGSKCVGPSSNHSQYLNQNWLG